MNRKSTAAVSMMLAAAVAGAWSGASFAARGGNPGPPTSTTKPKPHEEPAKRLTLSGDVENLVPGAHATLRVLVGNPNPVDVRIASLEVVADDASALCPAGILTIDTPPVGAVIPARGSTIVAVGIAMTPNAPDACREATFPLHYAATATRAR